jgi:photosystem II stability/assembly factor-like uncharacterized protein
MGNRLFLLFLGLVGSLHAQTLKSFNTDTDASFRGISAVSEKVCWVSGSTGTVLRTINGGKQFTNVSPPEAYNQIQFRDIQAFGQDTALILSAGLPAVILKTVDGGKSWKETYRNEQAGVFFDGMDFWDNSRGMAFSDAPAYKLLIIQTKDQGESWQTIDSTKLLTLAFKQGGFAASGTSICTYDHNKVVIGLGGAASTLLYSQDAGLNWTKQDLPISAQAPAAGIFSIDFFNARLGFAVGGNYQADSLTAQSVARTIDGGLSWHAVKDTAINGKYRSCIQYVSAQKLITISRTGCSLSIDGGVSWKPFKAKYYSISVAKDKSIWLSGSEGRVARLKW